LSDQLALFGELVHRRHARCVGVLLLLDAAHDWTLRVPAQRCGRTAASWSVLARHVPQLGESHVLAGTYQTRVLGDGEDAADAPPPCDGVHFEHRLMPDCGSVFSFLRAEGRIQPVPGDSVIHDDLEAALEECMPRLTLA
jgi:hypothetical protein